MIFSEWFKENNEWLKSEYRDYKKNMKLDGFTREILAFKTWAKDVWLSTFM